VAEWIYFIHLPRDNFAETMTEAEQSVYAIHFARFTRGELCPVRVSLLRGRD
jgi:hypothetical protein